MAAWPACGRTGEAALKSSVSDTDIRSGQQTISLACRTLGVAGQQTIRLVIRSGGAADDNVSNFLGVEDTPVSQGCKQITLEKEEPIHPEG